MSSQSAAVWIWHVLIAAVIVSGYLHLAWRKQWFYIALSLLGSLTVFAVVLYRVGYHGIIQAVEIFILINASFVLVSVTSAWALAFHHRGHNDRHP